MRKMHVNKGRAELSGSHSQAEHLSALPVGQEGGELRL